MKKNTFTLEGKVIVLTGAAGFLGQGYAEALAEAGAIVYAWDNKAFNPGSENIIPQCVDVTDEQMVRDVVRAISAEHGRIDALINNAALNPAVGDPDSAHMFAPYTSYPIDLFRRELDVNLVGPAIVTKAVAESMITACRGSVVNVASEVSLGAHDHRVYDEFNKYKSPGYTASKTGVVGLTRQWAAFLGQYGVRVNAISIGGVRHPNMPSDFAERFGQSNMLGRMAEPGEYNDTMVYLCSDASSFMTGANLVIDGGKSAW